MTAEPPYGRGLPGNSWNLLDGTRPDEAPTVSVVVAHYRQQRELDRTLAALARQTHPADRLEVIVVDDGSPEPPRVPHGVTLLVQEDRGFRLSAARNLGAAYATGRILCFLDADTAPEPAYIERMVRLPALAPETVAVGHRRHADLSRLPPAEPVERAEEVALEEPRWLLDEYAASGDLLRADQRSYRFVIGAVVACSRWFFGEVGGFDETFTSYGGEDWEWAHRAWTEGAVFAHVPDAVAWHDGPDWAGRDEVERRRQKNGETLRLADLVPVTGSRGLGVRPGRADVVVRLGAAPSAAAAYLAVDSVLAALPHARVVVPSTFAETFAADQRVGAVDPGETDARVVVDMPDPFRIDDPQGLAAAVDLVGNDDLGTLELRGPDGASLHITARRAALRNARWGRPLFRTETREVPGIRFVDDDPELAAYLGGWGEDPLRR